ncbi:MAG: LacI family DNA-binding transcriptional regulator [Lachnospiraceae bacterium]
MNINEIAAMAGVSRATVSRYLNGGYVSNEKKSIIKDIIEKTGYKPLSSAQTLRSHRTNYIGVIIPKINSDSIGRMVLGISHILTQHNYQLLLACTNNNEKEELNYLNLFKENHVDGIILIGTILTPSHKKSFKALSVPIVILGQNVPGYSCVYMDDFNAAKELTSQMTKKSEFWGVIHATQRDISAGVDRLHGFLDALEQSGKIIDPSSIIESPFTFEGGYLAAKKLLCDHPETDSILCATDTMAAGALRCLHEIGKKVPKDVQIAGLGDNTLSQATFPLLSTIHFPYRTSGEEATRILLEMIDSGKNIVTKELKLGFHLVRRDSLR